MTLIIDPTCRWKHRSLPHSIRSFKFSKKKNLNKKKTILNMTLLASNRFRSNHVNTYREEERESYDGHSNLNWTSIVCKIVDLFVCLFVSLCISLLFIMKNGQFAFYIWNGARIIREYINGSSSKHGANDYCPSHEAIGQEAKNKKFDKTTCLFRWLMHDNESFGYE